MCVVAHYILDEVSLVDFRIYKNDLGKCHPIDIERLHMWIDFVAYCNRAEVMD